MTREEVDKVLGAIDQIAEVSGSVKIADVISSFQSKIPNEMREIVLAQVREEAAKAIVEGLDRAKTDISSVSNNQEILDKLKQMGPQND